MTRRIIPTVSQNPSFDHIKRRKNPPVAAPVTPQVVASTVTPSHTLKRAPLTPLKAPARAINCNRETAPNSAPPKPKREDPGKSAGESLSYTQFTHCKQPHTSKFCPAILMGSLSSPSCQRTSSYLPKLRVSVNS